MVAQARFYLPSRPTMHMPRPNHDSAAVILDYGVDTAQFHDGDLRLSPRGLELKTRWQFELGSELGINVVLGVGSKARKLKLQGIVVGCHRDANCPEETPYLLTLIFLDPPEELAGAVRQITRTLARRRGAAS